MGSQPTRCPQAMRVFWAVLCSLHLCPALLSASDRCSIQQTIASPLLESLQCHNDFESNVYCRWRDRGNEPLQLWYTTGGERKLCVPYSPAVSDQSGTIYCKYKASGFTFGITHTAFFLGDDSVCSSVPQKPVALSQHLRARTPVDLSTRNAGDGGRRISWSSPYTSNKSLWYQLRYRTDTQSSWTTKNVTNTSVTLEKQLLLPGHKYEAKVRARASVGQWSNWSPVVSWHTEQDPGQPPRLQCVLNTETEVACSWEVSSKLADSMTYQLHCGRNHSAPLERCCKPFTSEANGTLLRYSCLLNVKDPAQMLLELRPARNAKSFEVSKHIYPKPPKQVEVKDRDSKWVVSWTKPTSVIRLSYQLCYYTTQDQGSCAPVNVSSDSYDIPGAYLLPSQKYQVKVRSVVVPGEGPTYEGIPSEWTEPKEWTSHSATFSINTFLYVLISVLVAAVFLTFYCSFPKCHRKLILWVESVPSPGKSKILSDIKAATGRPLVQSEDTFICKVLDLDTVSTCSSRASLWPNGEKSLGPDEGFWNCDHLMENAGSSDTSSMSFSGPYILCQTNKKSTEAKTELKEDNTPSADPPLPVACPLYGEGYVCLPSRSKSRSTQDLVSRCDADRNAQQRLDTAPRTDEADIKPEVTDQPPAYTPEPTSSWPQGGPVQASGYCVLPQPQ